MPSEPRHILMMPGGKDSTALAIYMRNRVAGMEYVFCDTDKELEGKLKAFLLRAEDSALKGLT